MWSGNAQSDALVMATTMEDSEAVVTYNIELITVMGHVLDVYMG
jgi:hypothetical protein